ncbi:hypothetical protein GCM10009765_84210 [Fodinicola feengrottensis]|uniref:Uncharacterized protein n=1 Tax=Fodinicola feengrottensis TaxID=435914 RepID=A0ABP4VI97_9ACTN
MQPTKTIAISDIVNNAVMTPVLIRSPEGSTQTSGFIELTLSTNADPRLALRARRSGPKTRHSGNAFVTTDNGPAIPSTCGRRYRPSPQAAALPVASTYGMKTSG